MTWLLKIEWDSKEAMERFVEGLKPFDDPAEGIIDMEFEELEENNLRGLGKTEELEED